MLSNNIRDLEGEIRWRQENTGHPCRPIQCNHSLALIFRNFLHLDCCTYPIWTSDTMGIARIPQCSETNTSISTFRKHLLPLQVMPAMKDTAITNTLFGLLLGIGILIGHLI